MEGSIKLGNLECSALNVHQARKCRAHSSKCKCTYCVQHSNNKM